MFIYNVVFALDCVGEGVWTAEGEGEYSYIMSSLLQIVLVKAYGRLMAGQAELGQAWKLKQVKRQVGA